MDDAELHSAQLLERAKARLNRLDYYPAPVDLEGVRLVSAPWVFRLPGMRRFGGYALGRLILVRSPVAHVSEDLVVHELCHVWQWQHRPLRMWLAYCRPATFRRDRSHYDSLRYEAEARRAVAETADLDRQSASTRKGT